jgi:hypothetical protein
MENKIITFEDIQKANETIITTDIKGKNYAEVNQRIKAFRMVYPTGTIATQLLNNENGVCVFKAVISDENGKMLATGTAYEKEGSTFINKTSYIENCETSAIGRALGIAGFGIDTSIASAEEVQNAINNQEEILRLIPELNKLLDETKTDRDKFYTYYKVKTNGDMTLEQLQHAIGVLKKKVGE